jgi:hypothetical protein
LANGNLNRRLDRLEASMLPRNQRVLQITVTRIGEPDRTIELRLFELGRRRRPWQENGALESPGASQQIP